MKWKEFEDWNHPDITKYEWRTMTPKKQATHLIGLPGEIRNMIYRQCVGIGQDLHLLDPLPTLLSTSAQVRHEALPVFCGENIFEIRVEEPYMQRLGDWLNDASEDRTRHFTKIRLCFTSECPDHEDYLEQIMSFEKVAWEVSQCRLLPTQFEFDYGQRELRQSAFDHMTGMEGISAEDWFQEFEQSRLCGKAAMAQAFGKFMLEPLLKIYALVPSSTDVAESRDFAEIIVNRIEEALPGTESNQHAKDARRSRIAKLFDDELNYVGELAEDAIFHVKRHVGCATDEFIVAAFWHASGFQAKSIRSAWSSIKGLPLMTSDSTVTSVASTWIAPADFHAGFSRSLELSAHRKWEGYNYELEFDPEYDYHDGWEFP